MATDLLDTMLAVQTNLGFVETPEATVDLMVEKLFAAKFPVAESCLLDPGCGNGPFIDGVLRWCKAHDAPIPHIVGIEAEPVRAEFCRRRFRAVDQVEIRNADFLRLSAETFDFIIGNPPYVSLGSIEPAMRSYYRQNYSTATGRFDLYLLFFEQALGMLRDSGRLVFVTPEKFLYVETAAPLRRLLATKGIEAFHLLDELTFGKLVTYPLVTTVTPGFDGLPSVKRRDGSLQSLRLPKGQASWMPHVLSTPTLSHEQVLSEICVRISCGVATGADSVFVVPECDVPKSLRRYCYPTLSGREIKSERRLPLPRSVMLIPYGENGKLMPERELCDLLAFLKTDARLQKLLARTCVRHKPWYAFHENPPLADILRPKILYKDISETPLFVVDREGVIVPRHSIYYVVPKDPSMLDDIADYLSSDKAREWLLANCQRAAKGFTRVQSHVLKQLPIPRNLIPDEITSELEILTA